MALSQVQCLDDNHVNPRTHEAKPEFLYSEDQRLALEALLRDGREEFLKYLGARGLRGFLSDPELESLAGSVEPYDPGSDLFPESRDDDDDSTPLSLHYWPELSDTSTPQMDLGWPESISYRGVTRATVYTQPPLEGDVHIKEVVRKMIAQAQKVIAVVMDVFTDVDIFKDLLDIGFKKRVSVYILLECTTLPHFRSMVQRANMHAGHLKHLRVRCTDGREFITRSCNKVRGRMGHRFMFIDGDKAVSGSYSFTWMSSRLDKNLITVVTGQAVEAFDKLFCLLYATSSLVDLREFAAGPEPEQEPIPQPVSLVSPAAIARKLYSPKYALVALSNPSPTPSAGTTDPQNPDTSKDPEGKKRRRGNKEAVQEDPIHPGLLNLEKACLISYLPTWPEPDPPSDVIGFINIRDNRKPNQVHLQRSEMFETSQAVRFSSPFNMPEEMLPEVAKPRQFTFKHNEKKNLQPARDESKAPPGVSSSKAEAPAQKSPAAEPKPDKDAGKTPKAENKRHSNTNQDTRTPHSSKACSPNAGKPSHTTQTVTLPGSNASMEANSNPQRGAESQTQTAQTKTVPPHTEAVHTQHTQTPTVSSTATSPTSSPSRPQNVSIPTSMASPTPPIPKPRTVQLVIKDGVHCDGQQLPGFSVFKPKTRAGPPVVHEEAAVVQTPSHKVIQNNSGVKAGQSGMSQETKNEEAEEQHGRTGVQNKPEADILITDTPKAESANTQKIIPKDVMAKTSIDGKLIPQIESVAAAHNEIKAFSDRELPDGKSVNATESKTYLARAHAPQDISYSEPTSPGIDLLETVDCLKASTHTPVTAISDNGTHTPNTFSSVQQQPAKAPLRLHIPDLNSPTPEREQRSRAALMRTPTPDGFLPRTPDSQTQTPDFRTPMSDGYFTPRPDSALSGTSEEYYECSESPIPGQGTTEERVSLTKCPNANTSPAASAATLTTTDRNSSSSGSQCSSRPSSMSSLIVKEEEEEVANGREEDENESVEESRVEEEYQETVRRGSEDAKKTADHFKQGKDPPGTEEDNKEAQSPERKKRLNQSAAVGAATPGEPTNDRTEPTGDLQPKMDSLERKRPDKDRTALGPGLKRGERSTTEGQVLHPPKSPRGQQQDAGSASPSQPSRPSRSLSSSPAVGPQPRQLNQAEKKTLHGSFQNVDNTSSARRPPSRPPPPATAGRGQESLLPRQPSAQARTKAGPPKPQSSPLPTTPDRKQIHPQNEAASAQEVQWQEEGKTAFGFTFSRLYSLKGLKDKVSKLPAQSRRGSSSSLGQRRKSTS